MIKQATKNLKNNKMLIYFLLKWKENASAAGKLVESLFNTISNTSQRQNELSTRAHRAMLKWEN